MRRTSFADMNCSIARALDLIGEWWTLLIVREAFLGCQRFGEFEARLGIAPNVLSQRLGRLVEGGILQVASTSQSGKARKRSDHNEMRNGFHSRVRRGRCGVSPPPVSHACSPNRTCTFRCASGSPEALANSGFFIHLRSNLRTGT